jgi:hypothetical protein
MRKQLRRSLFAAAFAGTALTACGGGGGFTGSPAPAPGSPPPPPPPPVAGSYFLAGRAGGTVTPQANVPFSDLQVGTSGFALEYVNPTSLPLAFNVTNTVANQLEASAIGLDLASVSEYFASGGTATAWGTRYRVYAEVTPAAPGGLLYAIDLRKSTPTQANPAPAQRLSSAIVSGNGAQLPLCSTPPTLFDNYASASLSWIVFHAKGAAGNCGSLDDQYYGVQLSMTSAVAPKSLAQLEPVGALYDASGSITGYLAINHPALDGSGNPVGNIALQQLDTNFASAKTLVATLTGKGANFGGSSGDFFSLGVSAGNVWLYWDNTGIYAVNLTTGAASSAIATLATGDSVQGRAVFDGTKAYVAVDNATAGLGSYVLQIDTSNNTLTATQARDVAATAISLVGVTSNNLVYLLNDRSAIKSVLKSNLTQTTTLKALTFPTQFIDPLMASGGASTSAPPVAFLVGDAVYFTVADTSGTSGTFAKQALYVLFNGSGVPATAVAVGSTPSVSAVLGVVAPSPVPTSGPVGSTGALVLTGGNNYMGAPGTAAFAYGGPQMAPSTCTNATPATAASLGVYSGTGALTSTLGALSSMGPVSALPLCFPIVGVALNGDPVQAGMPAMLQLYGTDGTGAGSDDIAVFSSAIPLAELSGFASKNPRAP